MPTASIFVRAGLPPWRLTRCPYFQYYRNMSRAPESASADQVARYADMFSAMGTEPRLRIMRLLLSAHPEGMIPSDISSELEIPASSLSHHLDKLKNETLVSVRRDSKFLWYTANTAALRELIQFLYAECCTRNKAIKAESLLEVCKK